MSMQRTGAWGQVANLIRNIGPEMRMAKRDSLYRFAAKTEAIAVTHISAQDLGWKRLKAATIRRKKKKGFSTNILVETSTYFQSITSWVANDTAYIGVKRGVYEPDGTEVANIAAIHEFGAGAIPARPLWKPSLNEALIWHTNNNLPSKLFWERIKRYF